MRITEFKGVDCKSQELAFPSIIQLQSFVFLFARHHAELASAYMMTIVDECAE